MNILETLIQLRDDLKLWVTNNLNALSDKIDAKTFPIDRTLSNTSTNPVQNKTITSAIENINSRVGNTAVATQISNAIAKQPHFSGDYNDLTNAPNIAEDDSGNMVIADESGNVIFKADADGIHTTALSLNGEPAATETYVNAAIAEIPTPDVSGQINAHNTSEAAHEDIRQAINTAKEELSESIVAESDEWKVVDNNGNIIFSVDADGAHTTAMSLNGDAVATEGWVENKNYLTEHQDISGKSDVGHKHVLEDITDLPNFATEDYVDNKVAGLVNSAPEALDTLGELAIALENHEDAYDALLETVGSKATPEDLANLKTELSESIVAESEEWKVVDDAGNIVLSVDAEGVNTTAVKINHQDVLTIIDDKIADAAYTLPEATSNTLGGVKVGDGLKANNGVLSVDVVNDLTSESTTHALSAAQGKVLNDKIKNITTDLGNLGGGDMLKAVYDIDGDGVVDNAAKLEGHDASYFVASSDFNTIVGTVPVATQITNAINAIPTPDVSGQIAAHNSSETSHEDIRNLIGEVSTLVGGKNVSEQITEAINKIDYPVDSVNGKTGVVVLTANDVGALPSDTEIPSISGLATETYVDDAIAAIPETDLTGYYTKEEIDTAIDTAREEITETIVSKSQEFKVVDGDGNIVFQVDANGVDTTAIKIENQDVLTIVDNKISNLVDSAPETLNTLNELATALGDDPNFATTVATEIGKKVDKETGKGLSANDFTDNYKNILDNLGSMAFEETDPTVPAWAKADTKPAYTASEVGALPNTTKLADLTDDANHRTVSDSEKSAWNAKSDFSGDYSDLTNAPNIVEDHEGNLVISDDNGNIIFKSDATGFETTTLTAQNIVLNGIDIEELIAARVQAYVDEAILGGAW